MVNWKNLNPVMKNALVATCLMDQYVMYMPAQEEASISFPEHALLTDNKNTIIGPIPMYSEAIEEAWKIIEKYKNRFNCDICAYDLDLPDQAVVYVYDKETNMNYGSSSKLSAADAICLGYLRAFGVNLETDEDDDNNSPTIAEMKNLKVYTTDKLPVLDMDNHELSLATAEIEQAWANDPDQTIQIRAEATEAVEAVDIQQLDHESDMRQGTTFIAAIKMPVIESSQEA